MCRIIINGEELEEFTKNGKFEKINDYSNYEFGQNLSKAINSFEENKLRIDIRICGCNVTIIDVENKDELILPF